MIYALMENKAFNSLYYEKFTLRKFFVEQGQESLDEFPLDIRYPSAFALFSFFKSYFQQVISCSGVCHPPAKGSSLIQSSLHVFENNVGGVCIPCCKRYLGFRRYLSPDPLELDSMSRGSCQVDFALE